MKTLFTLLACGLLAVGAARAEPPAGYEFSGYAAATHNAAQSGKPIFLYLGRHGCGYCDKTNQESFSKREVHAQLSEAFELAYVDTEGSARLTLASGERMTEAKFAERLNAVGTPVFFALQPDGAEIARLYGYQSAARLLAFKDYVTAEHYKTQTFRDYVARVGDGSP